MPWTEKQEQVIKERDKTILVSAAAGSGKTATLVERIYQKIIDTEHPVDITSFLVVTFTKAAAAQMKEKLLKKLEEAQEQYPESEHIAKQNMLIQSADITTIDSFCLNIVKEYFSFLNLDPSVGIGDPGMLEMLKYDVMTELFETKYAQLQEQPDTEFGRLLELFCDGKRNHEDRTARPTAGGIQRKCQDLHRQPGEPSPNTPGQLPGSGQDFPEPRKIHCEDSCCGR